MAIPNKTIQSTNSLEIFCDRGIVFSLCALIFVLPASIALLDTFAGVAVLLYLLKKINRMLIDWPVKTSHLNLPGKVLFAWKGFAPPVNFLNRPLQFLAITVFISVIFSQYPTLSLFAFFGKFLKSVFLFFSFIEVFNDEKRIRIFVNLFFLSALTVALSGVVQHYTGRDFLKGHHTGMENGQSSHRISASFFGANGFGAYLLPIIGLVAHLLYTEFFRKKSWPRIGALALFLVLLLTCLCWTYSRSSWIGYLALLFTMVWMDKRKIIYAGILFIIFIFIFLPSLNNVRHMDLINDNYAANQKEDNFESILEHGGSGRRSFWNNAISIIRTSPVWGTGLNTYAKIIRRNPDPRTWWYAHNCYLQMVAETGFLGTGCFVWMVFVLFKKGLNHCKRIKEWWPLTFLQGTLAGLFGFMLQSFFDNTFYTVQLGVLMWLFFGLTVAIIRLNNKHLGTCCGDQ